MSQSRSLPSSRFPQLNASSQVHIVGIGGAGMSAVARILLESGVKVSGSDRQMNDIARVLQRDGARVYEGHAANQIAGASVLFATSAAKDDNPEIAAARAAGIPILTRREFFKLLLPGKRRIAVAGTHGKTTTTAMIVHILRETGRDPAYIVGGTLINTGDNAHVGQGSAFVVEADEYGGMFLGLAPHIAVITNVEHDHPDIFPTLEDVLHSFRQFASLVPDDGTLIVCADDVQAWALGQAYAGHGPSVVTYGIDSLDTDWQAVIQETTPEFTAFVVKTRSGSERSRQSVQLKLPGRHNVLNALAAVAAASAYQVPLVEAAPTLSTFKGTQRRFELMGQAGEVSVFSDYGHHPTAIRAVLAAARQRYRGATIRAVWQPHTYSRTRLLADEFARAFFDANTALITDIYAARESPAANDIDCAAMARLATTAGHGDARCTGSLAATFKVLEKEVQPGDIVIIFSAGDAPQIGEMLLRALREREK